MAVLVNALYKGLHAAPSPGTGILVAVSSLVLVGSPHLPKLRAARRPRLPKR